MAVTQRPLTREEIRKILNNMTLGTQRAKLGDLIYSLQSDVISLKARVAALENA